MMWGQLQRSGTIPPPPAGFALLDPLGRGAAPGAAGTRTSGLPPLPEGFELVQPEPIDQGNVAEKRASRAAATPRNGVPASERVPLIRNSLNEHRSIHKSAVQSSTVSKHPMPEAPTWNWSDEQKRAIQAQVAKARSPKELDDFARALSGGRAGIGNAKDVLSHYRATGKVGSVADAPLAVSNKNPDGAIGAAARGLADPFYVLDEMGGFVDTLGITPGRESIWNSDRSFGDILYGNIDQNRSILQADERDHPGPRFGGQIVSNVLLPFGNKARGAAQFAKWGAGQGALAGFGAGEGNPLERLPSTLLGTGVGATVGYGAGRALDILAPRVRGFMGRLRRSLDRTEFDAPPPPVGRQDNADRQPQQLEPPSPQTPIAPKRSAVSPLEARVAAQSFVGRTLTNGTTGLKAVVTGMSLKKMTSESAVTKSTSPEDHALAVANVDDLFPVGRLLERKPDKRGEPTIAAVSRYTAPMQTADGRIVTVKMTVKETVHPSQPNPLYTVETLEVEPRPRPAERD